MTREVGFFFSAFLPFNEPQLPVPEVPTPDPHCSFAVSSKKNPNPFLGFLSQLLSACPELQEERFRKSAAGQGLAKAVPADRRVEAAAFTRYPLLKTCTPALRTPTDPPLCVSSPPHSVEHQHCEHLQLSGVFLGCLRVNGFEWYI